MTKTKLYWVAFIVGLLACIAALGSSGFAKGVQQSDTCTKNKPDHFMCRMFGDD